MINSINCAHLGMAIVSRLVRLKKSLQYDTNIFALKCAARSFFLGERKFMLQRDN